MSNGRKYLLTAIVLSAVLGLSTCMSQLDQSPEPTGTPDAPDEKNFSPPGSSTARAAGDIEYLSGIVEIPSLGTISPRGSSAAQGILVDDTIAGTGADTHLQHGDIVKAIDGEFIDSWESFYSILFEYFGGQYVRVWFIRDGRKMSVDLPLAVRKVPAEYEAMLRDLAAGNPVRLAVVVGELERLGDYTEEENRIWKADAEDMLLATTESAWSSNLRSFRRFSIVDRSTLDTIIEEQKLTLSGMVEDSVQLGRLAGATHVLEVSAKEYPDQSAPRGKHTNYFNRLVDVETGVVAASVVYRRY